MNNAIKNIYEQVLYRNMFLFLLDMYLEMEFLGYVITLCLTFLCFPK